MQAMELDSERQGSDHLKARDKEGHCDSVCYSDNIIILRA